MESEQEKADLQVCLGLLSFLLTTLTSVLYLSYKPILIMNLYPIGSKLLGGGGWGGGSTKGRAHPATFCLSSEIKKNWTQVMKVLPMQEIHKVCKEVESCLRKLLERRACHKFSGENSNETIHFY